MEPLDTGVSVTEPQDTGVSVTEHQDTAVSAMADLATAPDTERRRIHMAIVAADTVATRARPPATEATPNLRGEK